MFTVLGKDPLAGFPRVLRQAACERTYGIGELLLKATPLMLCALGLALGFRANVWNIGAEGQLTMGAIAGGGVALWLGDSAPAWRLPAMLLAGTLGGMAWAAIPAYLRNPLQHQRNPGHA